MPAARSWARACELISRAHARSPAATISRNMRCRSSDSAVVSWTGLSRPPMRFTTVRSRAAGRPAALLGTVVNRIGGRDNPVQLTTAESLDLQRMFREMVAAGDRACALEISSHALAQERAAGIDFDAVVFSNLTRPPGLSQGPRRLLRGQAQ